MATATQTRTVDNLVQEAPLNPYRWVILFGLVTASVMEVLDTTVVNVALPQMMGNLGATPDEIGWVSTGYILSNVVVLPMTAWLSHRFGRKNYLAFSIILFIVASFFCGTSRTLTELVFWRVMQGAGGAALLSTAQATLVEIFPRKQMGMVTAFFGLGMVTAPTIAPALGGWITDNYTWPWVFFINVPIGIVSVSIVLTFLQNSIFSKDTEVIDWTGIALLAVGLISLQYVLEEGVRYGWYDDANITRLSILATVCLVSFFAWELSRRNRHPIVDLRVVKNMSLRMGIILSLALGFGLYGGVFLYPMFVQRILHFTAIETGMALLPGGIASAVGMITCGRLLNRPNPVDPRRMLAFGVTMFVISMWLLSQLTSQSGMWDTQFALIIRGAGLGFLFIPINVAAFSSLRGQDIAQASALLNLSRQLGGSFGIAVLNTYVVTMEAFHRSNLVSHISSANPFSMDRIHALTHMFTRHGYSVTSATDAAHGMINNAVNVQAATLAYDDAFLLLGLSMLIASPSVLLLKRRLSAPPSGGAPH
ncbi:MAG TPA: DHA2 family efflux MFS transporter permease subunit [Capsulimonadaceae bacterium]|jgi:DHA2 family multidrug resistance protein